MGWPVAWITHSDLHSPPHPPPTPPPPSSSPPHPRLPSHPGRARSLLLPPPLLASQRPLPSHPLPPREPPRPHSVHLLSSPRLASVSPLSHTRPPTSSSRPPILATTLSPVIHPPPSALAGLALAPPIAGGARSLPSPPSLSPALAFASQHRPLCPGTLPALTRGLRSARLIRSFSPPLPALFVLPVLPAHTSLFPLPPGILPGFSRPPSQPIESFLHGMGC